MDRLFLQMARSLPLTLLVLALLALLVVLVVAIWITRRRRVSGVAAEDDGVAAETVVLDDERGPTRLQRSFREAEKILEHHSPQRRERLRIPRVLLLGDVGSRAPDLLSNAGMVPAFAQPQPETVAPESRLTWWFFHDGTVLDLGGRHVLDLNVEGGAERAWQSFLHQLERSRPERPLDAVVLTVSAADLLSAPGPDTAAPGEDRLEELAEGLHRRVASLERRLGMRVPVSVLITGCERLRGFGGFVSALRLERRWQEERGAVEADDRPVPAMLGWSSPYGPEVPYRGPWSEEAFGRLGAELDATQARLYGNGAAAERAQSVFYFPLAVTRLAAPVRKLLDSLFRPSVHHLPLLFRGLYLTGSDEVASHFLKDLFEHKVFPEARLATPVPGALLARNRRVRWLQMATVAMLVVLGLGVWAGWAKLEERNQNLRPFLQDASQGVELMQRQQRMRQGALPDGEHGEAAARLLQGLARVDARRYWSLFLPTSWFSDFSEHLRGAIVVVYDEVLFEALFESLEGRASSYIVAGNTPVARAALVPTGARGLVSPTETPEFRALESFVLALVRLEDHGRLYNGLPETQNLTDLAALMDYLFDTHVPPDFFDDSTLYQEALSSTASTPFEPAAWREAATARAGTLVTDLYRKMYQEHPLVAKLGLLEDGLTLSGDGPVSADDPDPVAHLRALARLLADVDALLAQSGLAWSFQPTVALGPAFERVLTAMEASEFFGPEFAYRVRTAGTSNYAVLEETLRTAGSPWTGAFLRSEGGVARAEMSEDLDLLSDALQVFLNESFVGLRTGGEFASRVGPGERLFWNEGILGDAAGLAEPYRRFREQSLQMFPPDFQRAVDRIARDQTGRRMASRIGQAQRFRSAQQLEAFDLESSVAAQVDDLERAAPRLEELVDAFDGLGLDGHRSDLLRVMQQQNAHLLQDVDRLLQRTALYLPRGGDFEGWDGTAPPAQTGYGTTDSQALGDYLDRQRERVRTLTADYARPALTALGDVPPGAEGVHRRWSRISEQLTAYDAGQTDSSLGRLEELIQTDLASLTLEDCLAHGADGPGGARDYFEERRRRLEGSLHQRCRELVGDAGSAAWGRVASLFERRLAGRFPFAASPSGDVAGVATASPEALRAFFQRLDAERKIILATPEGHPMFRGSGPEIRAFLDDLEQVRVFLAPFLANPDPAAVPRLAVAAEFRADRSTERAGDQIIDWRLSAGGSSVSLRAAAEPLAWAYGEDVSFALRWAKDSIWMPRQVLAANDRGAAHGRGAVEGPRVVYRYGDPWALLSFLRSNRDRARFAAPGDGEPDPQTLRFNIQTRPAAPPEGSAETVTAAGAPTVQVYLRLTLLDAESREPLAVPCFPVTAPRLGEPRVLRLASTDPEIPVQDHNWWCHGG